MKVWWDVDRCKKKKVWKFWLISLVTVVQLNHSRLNRITYCSRSFATLAEYHFTNIEADLASGSDPMYLFPDNNLHRHSMEWISNPTNRDWRKSMKMLGMSLSAERVMWQISWSQNAVCLNHLRIFKHAYWWCEPPATRQHPFGRDFKTMASINVGFVPAAGAENHSRTLICPYFLFAFHTAGPGFYSVWWSSVGLHVNSLASKTKQRGSSGKPEEIAVYSEEKQVHVS